MSPQPPSTTSTTPNPIPKLPPIPKGSKIHKRPPPRPQQPPSSLTSTIYLSSTTPLPSALKRVRKHISSSLRSSNSGTPAASKHASLHSRIDKLTKPAAADGEGAAGRVSVKVAGTGRAVEKVLKVASYFEQESDCVVEVRTGSVATIDDVVVAEGDGGEDETRVRRMSCLEVTIVAK